MSTSTPRTDAAVDDLDLIGRGIDEQADALYYVAQKLERELAIETERATHYRDEWQKERAKVRALQTSLESIADAWHTSHETNPFRAGDVMLGIAEKALGGAEGRV